MPFQQCRESFPSLRFFTEAENTEFGGGKNEPITAGISLKGNTKRNTILSSLSAIVVPYIKEIKSSLKCKNEPIYSHCLQVTLHHLLGRFARTKGNHSEKVKPDAFERNGHAKKIRLISQRGATEVTRHRAAKKFRKRCKAAAPVAGGSPRPQQGPALARPDNGPRRTPRSAS